MRGRKQWAVAARRPRRQHRHRHRATALARLHQPAVGAALLPGHRGADRDAPPRDAGADLVGERPGRGRRHQPSPTVIAAEHGHLGGGGAAALRRPAPDPRRADPPRSPRSVGFVVIEGIARACVLLGYLAVIAQVPSVRRVFEYHGAEHKTINCYEAGGPVDVEHVRGASRLHPRCGTGFLVVVALVSIVVFAPFGGLPVPLLVLSRVVLIPLVAAIAYEGIRGLARVRRTPLGRLALIPVLATQRLTTREPDDAQIEVAIEALALARAGDVGVAGTAPLTLAS